MAEKKPSTLKTVFWTLVVIIAIIAGISNSCASCSKDSNQELSEAQTDTSSALADTTIAQKNTRNAQSNTGNTKPPSVEAIEISLEDLYEAYESNEVRADNTYKGKNVRLEGIVYDIGSAFNQSYVQFKVGSVYYIQVYFKNSELSKLSELEKGQKISVVGVCEGKGFMSVNIKNAILENIPATSAPTNAQADTKSSSVEVIEISPDDLYEAYESNEVKADSTYKGKNIRLAGIVDDIGKGAFDQPYVKFSVGAYGFGDVRVYFKNSELSKLGDLAKGETVSVVGVCDGKSLFGVDVKNAILE